MREVTYLQLNIMPILHIKYYVKIQYVKPDYVSTL